MRKRIIAITAAATGVLLVGGGAVAAFAGASDAGNEFDESGDSSTAITGIALERATAAAIAAAGAGTVTESELGGDEAAYEIELMLDAGESVDVMLDDNFKVLNVTSNAQEGDGDGEAADDASQPNEARDGDGDGETADD